MRGIYRGNAAYYSVGTVFDAVIYGKHDFVGIGTRYDRNLFDTERNVGRRHTDNVVMRYNADIAASSAYQRFNADCHVIKRCVDINDDTIGESLSQSFGRTAAADENFSVGII